MGWDEDYTVGGWAPDGLTVGCKTTEITSQKRHKPMQGDLINRDEIEFGTWGCLMQYDDHLRSHSDGDGRQLTIEVEKYQDDDSWAGYRLRDAETQKYVTICGDWVRLRDESEAGHVHDQVICFERYESFRKFHGTIHGEIAYMMWFKTRGNVISLNSSGDLNSKGDGRHALFNFRDSTADEDDQEDYRNLTPQKAREIRRQKEMRRKV